MHILFLQEIIQNTSERRFTMIRNGNLGNTLAKNALDDIPHTRDDARAIVALVKEHGKITGYKLSDGAVLSKSDAIATARDGGIKGVGIAHNKDSEYLKAIPDQNEHNNLGNLPTI